jgi:hypothetical protein
VTTWDTLVRAVLLGTDREPVVPEELPEPIQARLPSTDDPTRLLLDAAALLAGQRKAGILPVSGIKPVASAPVDPRPLASPDAARRLARLLSGERSALLPEWLALAADRGLRVPPELLPALATAAANRTALRPAVTAAAGPRGPWLTAHTADWAFLADAPDHADESESTWRYGGTVARWAWLERARHIDPDGARAALAETWSDEPADGRAMFLEALSVGLGPADEEFLEAALDDRSGEVRRLAAALLVRVPGARLGQRMAGRLFGLVHISDDDLVIELPGAYDNAMRRDGVKQVPPTGTGSRAWWFRQIVAATPLSWWPGKPADVLRRPVTGPGGAGALHSALAAAAAEQRDPLWAQALLAVDLPTTDAADLVAVLPTDRWAGAVFVLAATNGLAGLVGLVLGLPTPWPADLGRLLLDELALQPHLRNLAPIADAAARAVPPDCLRHPITERVAEPGVSAWHHRLVETLLFRRAMHEEFR